MKKLAMIFGLLAMVAVALGTAWANGAECAKTTAVKPYTANIDSVNEHNLTSVRDEGADVVITITNVRVGPIGVNTGGKNLTTPQVVELYSGIMDIAGKEAPFTAAKVVNGTVTFRIPNTAVRAGVPVVEHVWGRSGNQALVHDPADPWICYEQNSDRLNTLAIGIVMYPDRPTQSLMSLGLGKLDQGKHPELN